MGTHVNETLRHNVSVSIQAKIIITSVAMTTFFLLGFAAYDYRVNSDQKYNDLQQSANIVAERLAVNLSIPLWDLDNILVGETLDAEMLNPNVFALVLVDSDGSSVFTAKQRDTDWAVQDIDDKTTFIEGIQRESDFSSLRDIKYKGEKIGTIRVFFTSRFIVQQLNEILITTLVTIIILDVMIFIAFLFLLRIVVIKPIMILSESVERMSRGELDIQLKLNRRDEIGLVANAIERMQISLRIAMGRLGRNGDSCD